MSDRIPGAEHARGYNAQDLELLQQENVSRLMDKHAALRAAAIGAMARLVVASREFDRARTALMDAIGGAEMHHADPLIRTLGIEQAEISRKEAEAALRMAQNVVPDVVVPEPEKPAVEPAKGKKRSEYRAA